MSRLRPVLVILASGLALGFAVKAIGAETKPLSRKQIVDLLQGSVSPKRVVTLIEQRGIDFEPGEVDWQAFKQAKASEEVLQAVRSARQVLPKEVMLERHRVKAKDFEIRGASGAAEAEYRAALQLDSSDAALHIGLARILAQQKNWNGAAAAYRQALRIKSNDAESHYQLGIVLRESGDQGGAINAWADAVKDNPDDPRPYEQLAKAFTERQDWKRAAVAYRGLGRLQPNSAAAYMGLGLALRNGGNAAGALAAYREAVRLNPNDPVARNNLGFSLEEKGDVQAALEQYQIAAQLNPSDSAIKSNFERASVKLKRPSLVKK